MYHFNEVWKQVHLHIIFQDFLLILPLCSIFSNGSHVGWSAGTSETNFKLDTLRMIVAKFGSNWFSGFRKEDFWKGLQMDKGRQLSSELKMYMHRHMVFNTTFNNISVILWQSVLLVEETVVLGENHWPATSHWQTLSVVFIKCW